MKFAVASGLFLASAVLADDGICPGFNYGIGHEQRDHGLSRWNVYDDSCKVVDGFLTTTANPCTQGIFGCSPPPIIFNEYTNTFTHLKYKCRTDPRSGKCGNDVISVCCRNDGH